MHMATRPFISDGLWNCICPAYRQLSATRPRIARRRKLLRSCQPLNVITSRAYHGPSPTFDDSARDYTELEAQSLTPSQSEEPEHFEEKSKWRFKNTYTTIDYDKFYQDQKSSRVILHPRGIASMVHYPDIKLDDTVRTRLHLIITEYRNTPDIHKLYQALAAEANRPDPGLVWYLVEFLVTECKEPPNRRLYMAMIRACSSASRGSAPLLAQILGELQDENIELDEDLCADVLQALSVHPDHNLQTYVLDHMNSKWYTPSASAHHNIAASLIKDKQIELAMEKIERMKTDGVQVQSWLHDMLYYVLADYTDRNVTEALKIVRLREDSGVPVTTAMWQHLLDIGSRDAHYEATTYVWRKRVEPEYMVPPTGILLNVLMVASRAGDVELASDVFRLLAHRKVVLDKSHYELLIDAYVAVDDLYAAFSILCIMKSSANMHLTDSSTRSVFSVVKSDPTFPDRAMAALERPKIRGTVPLVAMDLVIEVDIELGRFDDALRHWKQIEGICGQPSETSTMNVLIRGCYRHRRPDLAAYLTKWMIDNKVEPNSLTYERLVVLYSQGGDLETAFSYYREMMSRNWQPRQRTWLKLLRETAAAKDARCEEVIQDMIRCKFQFSMAAKEAIAGMYSPESEWLKPVFGETHAASHDSILGTVAV